ncbi:DUF945 family protein [Achromobacter piechaudii]|uniref:Protein YdgA n=1 Tax=Achromobacter piechaudii TaxID=72556 RepID=A0ABN7EW57_9BURK|nr:DUF945 family protein [Achromobacter piechaudii]CAB3677699.1 hypothetical protein LMG1873_01468 [Achromobacter piechaudii]CAB3842570.1 hypothetical protein LMG2828_01559 [Achromobacter piechaudii]CAB3941670.1 hypothetical protein LMG6103_00154 [Achromobacter piechaudii]
MKKSVAITLGVVIVGAGSWVGATWYTGKRIEESSQRHLAEANEKLAKLTPLFGLRIDQLKYDRSLFSTQARYGLSLVKNDKSPDAMPAGMIEFDAVIEHGPFPKTALSRGALAPKLAFVHAEVAKTDNLKEVFALTKDVSPLISDAMVSYSGTTTSTSKIAPVSTSLQGNTIDFSGMQITGSFDRELQGVTAQGVMDKLAIDGTKSNDPVVMAITGLTMDVNSHMGKFGVSMGDSGLKIKRIDVTRKQDDVKLSLDNFSYGVKLSEDDKSINVQAAYQTGDITVNDVALGNGQAVIKLAKLDGQAVKQLSDTYNQLMRQYMAQTEDEGLKDEQFQTMLDSAGKLLAGNPSFSIDPISWKTAKGESKLNFTLDLANPPDAKNLTPQEIAAKAIKRIDATLIISKPMVQDLVAQYAVKKEGLTPEKAAEDADQTVRQMSGMAEMFNVGKNDGDNIVGKFTYADGMGNLNGKEIPADELFSGLLGAAGMGSMGDDADEPMPGMGQEEPAEGATPAATGVMQDFSLDTVSSLLDDMGITANKQDGDEGPVLVLDPGTTGASDLRLEFLCNDFTEKCLDLVMTATYKTKKPMSLKAINSWNQEYRWTRAYLDNNNQAVLQMDMNAEGGIGKDNLQILLNTFISIAEDFNAAAQAAPAK